MLENPGLSASSTAKPQKSKVQPKSKNLVFFCHGGGFVALTTKFYEVTCFYIKITCFEKYLLW